MTRPAVIIGLGGTGQWVTTYVKKELLENNGGVMPANVKLLCFDTWPEANVGGQAEVAAEVVTIGNTKLDLNIEFIPLSGDLQPMGRQAAADLAPHISRRISDLSDVYSWFDSPYMLQHCPPALWNLSIGAGQIRQFGRLGFFNHATAIKATLARAFDDVKQANDKVKAKVDVDIIASFAGGTGAGMFLDMAVMARSLMSEFGDAGGFLRGIFVLPGTFNNGLNPEGQQMQARAYAAWRELARFMNLGTVYGAHTIQYDEHTSVAVNAKPFDQVFLVDASRPQNGFTTTRPENGVFPSVANFIATVMDDDAGGVLAGAVNKIQTLFDKKLGFSSFGAYSIQQPITHIIHEYALQSGRDLLRRWLAPDMVREKDREVPQGLKPDQNLERPALRGKQELKPFMTLPRHQLAAVVNRAQPDVANPTGVFETLQVLSAIYTRYEAFMTANPQFARLRADDIQGGYCAPDADLKVRSDSWLGRLMIPGDHQKTPLPGADGMPRPIAAESLVAEVLSTVRAEVSSSRSLGCDPTQEEAERIIGQVENDQNGYIVQHYGPSGGDGSFDVELGKLKGFNEARFKQILQVALLNLLNGTVVDVHTGFTGRLGFAEEFLNTLFTALEWFKTNYLEDVKKERAAAGYEQNAQSIRDTARTEMANEAGKKCVFFFNHPRAFAKQEEYLDVTQNYCEVRKDDKLIQVLDTLAKIMGETVNQALQEVAQWKSVLLTGPNSLYHQLEVEYAKTKNDIDHQAAINKAQRVENQSNYPQQYDEVLRDIAVLARIDGQMKRLRWDVQSANGLTISCEMFKDDAYQPLLKNPGDANKELINDRMKLAWADYGPRHTLIGEIGRRESPNYQTPQPLGQELVEHSGPMVMLSVPGAGIKSALRSVYPTDDIAGFNPAPYLDQVDAAHLAITPPLSPTVGYEKPPAHNKHKLTLIQWIDRLGVTDFNIYSQLKESYRHQIQAGDGHETASRLHIFFAEANAAFYEHHLPTWLGLGVRELSPRVVLLMTEVKRVRWFFQCYALGMIVHGRYDDTPGRWWRLVIPGDGQGVMAHDIEFYRSNNLAKPDPFELINAFITGKDVTTNAPIVWESVGLAVHRRLLNPNNKMQDAVDAQFAPGRGIPPVLTYPGTHLVVDAPKCWVDELRTQADAYFLQYLATHGGAPIETNPGWTWVQNVDYTDLADVARMMYIETLLTHDVIKVGDLALPGSLYRA